MQDFRKLDVWARAHDLTVQLHRATDRPADRGCPGLRAEMQREAASIPAAIAEGCGHASQTEFGRFLQRAIASSQALQYHLLLAHDLHLLPSAAYARLDARTSQVRQMLIALLKRVRAPHRAPHRAPPARPQRVTRSAT